MFVGSASLYFAGIYEPHVRASALSISYNVPYAIFGGHIFVFRNRLRTAVKLLVYDGNGFWLCHKRFFTGQLSWWPKSLDETVSLSAAQLQIVLQQGSPMEAQLPEPWHELENAE